MTTAEARLFWANDEPVEDRSIESLLADPDFVLPEHLQRREFGIDPVIAYLPTDDLIVLTQQRQGKNPMLGSLKESLAERNLQSEILVGRMNRESLEAYIQINNRIWRAEHTINDYQPDQDGNYYLVIAGHSRLTATKVIAILLERRHAQFGDCADKPATIRCKVFDQPTPHEILSMQLDENLHERPSSDRTAMAMVGLYLFGQETGEWQTKTEFVRKAGGKFSVDALSAALIFNELPDFVRGEVFDKRFNYGQAIELGKFLPHYRSYQIHKLGKTEADLTEDQVESVQDQVETYAFIEMNKIRDGKKSIKDCVTHFRRAKADMPLEQREEDAQGELDLMIDPNAEFRLRLRNDKRSAKDLARRAIAEPIEIHRAAAGRVFRFAELQDGEVLDHLGRRVEAYRETVESDARDDSSQPLF